MTSGPDSPEKTSEPQKSRSRSLAPAVFFAGLAVIALSVAVLYGISGLPGKEMAASGAKSCPTATTRLPAISAAAASSWSALRDMSITRAPLADSVAAIALPMPFEAPVTSATLPSNLMSMGGDSTARGGRDYPR